MKRIKISKGESLLLAEDSDHLLWEEIRARKFQTKQIFKDSRRSYVSHIILGNKSYILKEPREKNTRKWQRFLSIFRGSEAFREGKQLEKIREAGFLAPQFACAYEKRCWGMVFSSYVVYSYVEAEEILDGEREKLEKAFAYLQALHQKGYLHGDSQISNFLIQGDCVYLIDSKFQKNSYGSLGRHYENYYFELSCPNTKLSFEKDISYHVAKFWKDMKEFWVKRKTKRREKR